MKTNILSVFFLFLQCAVMAQNIPCYQPILAKADAFFAQGDYMQAMDYYDLSQLCPDAPDDLRHPKLLKDSCRQIIVLQRQQLLKALADAKAAQKAALDAQLKAEKLAQGALQLLNRDMPPGETSVFKYYTQQGDTAFLQGRYDHATGLYQSAVLVAQDSIERNTIDVKLNKIQQCTQLLQQASNESLALRLSQAVGVYKQLIAVNPTDVYANQQTTTLLLPTTMPMLNSLQLVNVSGGIFMLGNDNATVANERPMHPVTLSSFQLSRYEVTNAQYAQFLNDYKQQLKVQHPNALVIDSVNLFIDLKGFDSDNLKCGIYLDGDTYKAVQGYENRPVVYVSWYGAEAFCRFYGGSLPSEAQWEYAASLSPKGGNIGEYSGSKYIDTVAWFADNSENKTHAVGSKKANALGLYDMTGNVWEWCADRYNETYYNICKQQGNITNPICMKTSDYRVLRGGSWSSKATYARVARRYYDNPQRWYKDCGFRFHRK